MPDLFYILRGYLCALTTATVALQGHIRSLGYCLHLEYLYLIWLQTIHTAFLFTMSYFLLRYWQGTMYLLVSTHTCILSGYQTLNHVKYSLKLNSIDHQCFHRVAIHSGDVTAFHRILHYLFVKLLIQIDLSEYCLRVTQNFQQNNWNILFVITFTQKGVSLHIRAYSVQILALKTLSQKTTVVHCLPKMR